MVLDRSDYNVSNLYKGNWDPTSGASFVTKAVGTFVAATIALYVLTLAQSKGVPMMSNLLGRLPVVGDAASTEGGVPTFP